MTDPESTALRKGGEQAPAEGEDDKPRSRLSWAIGWVLVPGALLGSIFGTGALLGAHFHDSWFVGAIVWIVELFV